MSGIEIVGLILGGLPLVISAFEDYHRGLDPLKDYWRYSSTLKALQVRLRLEEDLYRGTLKRLLLPELSQTQADTLFPETATPNVPALWGTQEIEDKLQLRLGSKYDIFMDAIGVMSVTLAKLMDKLDIDLAGKPKWTTESNLRVNWEWRKIRRSFGKHEREDLLQTFEQYNKRISTWVQNNEILKPPPPLEVQTKSFMAYFDTVRGHACRLHSILERGWGCKCGHPHDANLQLDQRLDQRQVNPSFQVSISFYATSINSSQAQRLWKETQIEVEDLNDETIANLANNIHGSSDPITTQPLSMASNSTSKSVQSGSFSSSTVNLSLRPRKGVRFQVPSGDSQSPAQIIPAVIAKPCPAFSPILCLCEAIRNAKQSAKYVGSLPDTSNKQSARITVISEAQPSQYPPVSQALVPLRLESLLPPKQNTPSAYGELSRYQRLGLAVTLASAVLQLYKSPWMDELWGKNDIYFFYNGVDDNKCPVISRPYVSRPFASPTPPNTQIQVQQSTNTFLGHQIINKTLFALGIVLIELCLNKPFEDLRAAADPQNPNRLANIIEDFQIANDVIDDVYREGGDEYGYVVQRCLRCEFGVQDSRKKLDFDGFRNLVYEGVLEPLKSDYNQYSLYRKIPV